MIEYAKHPVNTDLNVFVVRNEQTGLWDASCFNEMCGYGLHGVSDDNKTKTAAEKAATVHRKHIRELLAEREAHHSKLGQIDWEARAVAAEAEATRLRLQTGDILARLFPAIECVLLDHVDELDDEKARVDANLSELAHVYRELTGFDTHSAAAAAPTPPASTTEETQ